MKSFTLTKDNKPKVIKNSILEAINETINVEINGNPDKFLNVQVTGKEKLVEKLEKFLEDQKQITREIAVERLRKQNFQFLNLAKMNEQIQQFTKVYEDMSTKEVPCPCDIFSSEDYEVEGNTYVLTSLNNIPDEYKEFLNPLDIERYFSENVGSGACVVEITVQGSKWIVEFTNKPKEVPSAIPYSAWLKLYKNFIASFIEATANLIGRENIKLTQNLTDFVMTGYRKPGE